MIISGNYPAGPKQPIDTNEIKKSFMKIVDIDPRGGDGQISQWEFREARKRYIDRNLLLGPEAKKKLIQLGRQAVQPSGLFVKLDKLDGTPNDKIDINKLLGDTRVTAKIGPDNNSLIIGYNNQYIRLYSDGRLFECDKDGASTY